MKISIAITNYPGPTDRSISRAICWTWLGAPTTGARYPAWRTTSCRWTRPRRSTNRCSRPTPPSDPRRRHWQREPGDHGHLGVDPPARPGRQDGHDARRALGRPGVARCRVPGTSDEAVMTGLPFPDTAERFLLMEEPSSPRTCGTGITGRSTGHATGSNDRSATRSRSRPRVLIEGTGEQRTLPLVARYGDV